MPDIQIAELAFSSHSIKLLINSNYAPYKTGTAVATELNKSDGVALAVTSTAIINDALPDTAMTRLVLNSSNAQ